MGIDVSLEDGTGTGSKAEISSHHALSVSIITPDLAPPSEHNRIRYLSVLLGTTGADSGTTNMNVNGSVNPVSFYVRSSDDYDIRIMGIAILIEDAGVAHNLFGGIAALTNGIDVAVEESGETTYIIRAAKTGGQVIAQAGFRDGYGSDATAFELLNWTATTDAQTIFIPIGEYVPAGVRIGRGTKDRIVATVRDDLTAIDGLTVRIFGYRHYP